MTIKRKRLNCEVRSELILRAALVEAEKRGYAHVTREQIAARANCAGSLVSHYLGSMVDMRQFIMLAAIERGNNKIIAQGLLDGNAHCAELPETIKRAAAESLV